MSNESISLDLLSIILFIFSCFERSSNEAFHSDSILNRFSRSFLYSVSTDAHTFFISSFISLVSGLGLFFQYSNSPSQCDFILSNCSIYFRTSACAFLLEFANEPTHTVAPTKTTGVNKIVATVADIAAIIELFLSKSLTLLVNFSWLMC